MASHFEYSGVFVVHTVQEQQVTIQYTVGLFDIGMASEDVAMHVSRFKRK